MYFIGYVIILSGVLGDSLRVIESFVVNELCDALSVDFVLHRDLSPSIESDDPLRVLAPLTRCSLFLI